MVKIFWQDVGRSPEGALVVAAQGNVVVPRVFDCPDCGELAAWISPSGSILCNRCELKESPCSSCWSHPATRVTCEECKGRGYEDSDEHEVRHPDCTRFVRIDYDEGEEPAQEVGQFEPASEAYRQAMARTLVEADEDEAVFWYGLSDDLEEQFPNSRFFILVIDQEGQLRWLSDDGENWPHELRAAADRYAKHEAEGCYEHPDGEEGSAS